MTHKISENVVNPWDRQPGEGARPWAAFREFLKRRDCGVVAQRLGVKVVTIHNYASKYNWTERATAHEAHIAQAEDEVLIDERAQLAKDQLRHWRTLRALAWTEIVRYVNASKAIGPEGAPGSLLKESTVVAIMKEATAAERLIIGEATERVETVGDGLSGWDLSKLSDDDLLVLRALEAKACCPER